MDFIMEFPEADLFSHYWGLSVLVAGNSSPDYRNAK